MSNTMSDGRSLIRPWSVPSIALLIGCIAFSFVPGIVGSTFGTDSTWYRSLDLPAWQPPNWAFGVVWPVLYLLIGVALFVILIKVKSDRRLPVLRAFIVQWVLNGAWSAVFFGLNMPLASLLVIAAMVVLVGYIILKVRGESPVASILLVPYLLWLLYATSLNLAIVVLNT